MQPFMAGRVILLVTLLSQNESLKRPREEISGWLQLLRFQYESHICMGLAVADTGLVLHQPLIGDTL